MADAQIGCTTEFVYTLQTGDRYVLAVVQDEVEKSLEAIAERLDGYRFDLVLERRDPS